MLEPHRQLALWNLLTKAPTMEPHSGNERSLCISVHFPFLFFARKAKGPLMHPRPVQAEDPDDPNEPPPPLTKVEPSKKMAVLELWFRAMGLSLVLKIFRRKKLEEPKQRCIAAFGPQYLPSWQHIYYQSQLLF